jgi:hypothetical protein
VTARWLAEHLIDRACRHLPAHIRGERYCEWTAELPAIFADPEIRGQVLRTVRALLYAADHVRGARQYAQHHRTQSSRKSRTPAVHAKPAIPFLLGSLAGMIGIFFVGFASAFIINNAIAPDIEPRWAGWIFLGIGLPYMVASAWMIVIAVRSLRARRS